jgi:hypothetical protein
MDAVSYPQEAVKSFILNNLIPLRIPSNDKILAKKFTIKWTPALLTLDFKGKEHHRTVGFLGPVELIASLLLGMGKLHFDKGNYKRALVEFNDILEHYPQTDAAPEATFLRGVDQYKQTGEATLLKNTYELLEKNHPNSQWTKRASPYRLL